MHTCISTHVHACVCVCKVLGELWGILTPPGGPAGPCWAWDSWCEVAGDLCAFPSPITSLCRPHLPERLPGGSSEPEQEGGADCLPGRLAGVSAGGPRSAAQDCSVARVHSRVPCVLLCVWCPVLIHVLCVNAFLQSAASSRAGSGCSRCWAPLLVGCGSGGLQAAEASVHHLSSCGLQLLPCCWPRQKLGTTVAWCEHETVKREVP